MYYCYVWNDFVIKRSEKRKIWNSTNRIYLAFLKSHGKIKQGFIHLMSSSLSVKLVAHFEKIELPLESGEWRTFSPTVLRNSIAPIYFKNFFSRLIFMPGRISSIGGSNSSLPSMWTEVLMKFTFLFYITFDWKQFLFLLRNLKWRSAIVSMVFHGLMNYNSQQPFQWASQDLLGNVIQWHLKGHVWP